MKIVALFSTLMFVAFAGFAQKEVRVRSTDNGKTFSYNVRDKGTLISIEVSDNSASTGYVWNAANTNENSLKFVGKSMIPPANPMPGAAGVSVFTYQLTGKPGTSKVKLELKRGEEVAADKTLNFTFYTRKPKPKPVVEQTQTAPAAPAEQPKQQAPQTPNTGK